MDVWISLCFLLLFSLTIWRYFKQWSKFVDPSQLVVFISGCDTGIGHRLAIHFSGIGCCVYAGCLNPKIAMQTLPESVNVLPLDITDSRSVLEAVELVQMALELKKQELWAVINNAGVCVFGQFEWQTWQQCERQVQVNLLGTMRLTKAFIPLLRKAKGRIITVSSINGTIAYPGLSVYSATKFALEGLCNSLRLELAAQHGIRVITVQPGDYARVTSIMSRHEQNARDMWNNMSQDDKDRYGDFFYKYHRATLKNYGLSSPSTFEGSVILKDMEHAVLSTSPGNRYISAPVTHKIVYKILALLPSWCTDFVLGKITEMLYSSDDGDDNFKLD